MAKKDKKTGKIPKSIGGVKLSKGLRKSGEKLIEKAGSPEGRRVLAAGLAMAGAAMARAKAAPTPPVPPVPPVPPTARQSGEGALPPHAPPAPPNGTGAPVVDPAQIADAVGQAATAFFDGLFGRKR
jgi:hypothetical protein